MEGKMSRTKKKYEMSPGIRINGFFRTQLVDSETGEVQGDSGWIKNTTTTNGRNIIAAAVGAVAGSYQIGYAAIGSGSTSNYSAETALKGVVNSYMAVTPTTAAVGTFQATCSFAGSNNTATFTVNEAGLFKTNAAGSMFCGSTFATSQMQTSQNLNLTYQLTFS